MVRLLNYWYQLHITIGIRFCKLTMMFASEIDHTIPKCKKFVHYFVCINLENVCFFPRGNGLHCMCLLILLTQWISHDYINVKLKIATHQTANFFSTRDVWLLFANQAGKRHVEHHKNFVHEKLRQVKKKCLFPNYLLQKANKQFCCVTDIIWRTQIYLLRDVENIRHSLVKASWRYQHTNDMESCVGKNCVEFIKYDWKMMWKSLQLGNNTQEMRWKHSYLHLNHLWMKTDKNKMDKILSDIFHRISFLLRSIDFDMHTSHILPKETQTGVFNTICIFRSHSLPCQFTFEYIILMFCVWRNVAAKPCKRCKYNVWVCNISK